MLSQLKVRHGPFAGMQYPDGSSVGSALFPKLLGTYESEIGFVINRVCSSRCSQIVNVGCAEGYYAVGLALRLPRARVFAADPDTSALAVCERLARLNGVSGRITTGTSCTSETLAALNCPEALVLSDCEGYEAELFTSQVAALLHRQHLLIEVHSFVEQGIESLLRQRFAGYHDIEAIDSMSPEDKVLRFQDLPELRGIHREACTALLNEGRPGPMRWLYMQPRAGAQAA